MCFTKVEMAWNVVITSELLMRRFWIVLIMGGGVNHGSSQQGRSNARSCTSFTCLQPCRLQNTGTGGRCQ
jgi:hypothetical protein